MMVLDFAADRVHFQSIVNGLKKEIPAFKKLFPAVVHKPVGMERNHNHSIFRFLLIFIGFNFCLFSGPGHDTIPIRMKHFG